MMVGPPFTKEAMCGLVKHVGKLLEIMLRGMLPNNANWNRAANIIQDTFFLLSTTLTHGGYFTV